MSVVLRRPEEADYTAIREMLKDAGLPVSDFISEHIAIVAEEHGKPVGAVGFERYGSIGLVLSVNWRRWNRRGGSWKSGC
jgi:hypothetical protein